LPRGLVVLPVSGPGFQGIGENSAESSYYTWVDQHNTFGLGENIPMSTANLNDGLVALKDGKMIVLRVPYPLGFYAKGFDGRIDDANAGWKGRGLWTTSGDRTPWLMEGGKGSLPASCTSSCAPIRWRTELSRSFATPCRLPVAHPAQQPRAELVEARLERAAALRQAQGEVAIALALDGHHESRCRDACLLGQRER
jgi:hypothetical protein